MNGQKYLEVVCRSCGHRVVVGLSAMLAQLHSEGLLKRAKDPDADLVRELYTSRVAQLPCPTCHATRLTWQPLDDEDGDDWGTGRLCEVCQRPIPRERLEVFPETLRCRDCQQSAERGEDSAAPQYCPRCGSIMELRLQRGDGLTRYVMYCPACRK